MLSTRTSHVSVDHADIHSANGDFAAGGWTAAPRRPQKIESNPSIHSSWSRGSRRTRPSFALPCDTTATHFIRSFPAPPPGSPPPPPAATVIAMLAAALKPGPSLVALSASTRKPAGTISFPPRLHRRALLSAAATAEGAGTASSQSDASSYTAAAAPPIDEARLAQVRSALITASFLSSVSGACGDCSMKCQRCRSCPVCSSPRTGKLRARTRSRGRSSRCWCCGQTVGG